MHWTSAGSFGSHGLPARAHSAPGSPSAKHAPPDGVRSGPSPMRTRQADGRYRLMIASRMLAAAVGGYALAAAWTAALSLSLAVVMPRVEAVLIATMLAWLVYVAAAGWAFYARSAWGAWGGTLLPALLLGACTLGPRWLAAQ